MIKCEKCGKEIRHIVTNCFNHDGTDSDRAFLINQGLYGTVEVETDSNWCGYGLIEKEQRACIHCPYCNEFPFNHQEIQAYEVVKIIMFRENGH